MTKRLGYRNFRASLRIPYPSWQAPCVDAGRFVPARVGAALQRALDKATVRLQPGAVQRIGAKGVARMILAATKLQDPMQNGPPGCSRMVQAGIIMDDIMVILGRLAGGGTLSARDPHVATAIVRRALGLSSRREG